MLTDNSLQLVSTFFAKLCRFLCLKCLTTTTEHPQTNTQVRSYNKAIFARLWRYVSEPQDSWDVFVQPLTWAYSTQTHACTSLFSLSLPFSKHLSEETSLDFPSETASDLSGNVSSLISRSRSLAGLAFMGENIESRPAETPMRYKYGYENRARKISVFKTDWFLHVDRVPLAMKTTKIEKDRQSDNPT